MVLLHRIAPILALAVAAHAVSTEKHSGIPRNQTFLQVIPLSKYNPTLAKEICGKFSTQCNSVCASNYPGQKVRQRCKRDEGAYEVSCRCGTDDQTSAALNGLVSVQPQTTTIYMTTSTTTLATVSSFLPAAITTTSPYTTVTTTTVTTTTMPIVIQPAMLVQLKQPNVGNILASTSYSNFCDAFGSTCTAYCNVHYNTSVALDVCKAVSSHSEKFKVACLCVPDIIVTSGVLNDLKVEPVINTTMTLTETNTIETTLVLTTTEFTLTASNVASTTITTATATATTIITIPATAAVALYNADGTLRGYLPDMDTDVLDVTILPTLFNIATASNGLFDIHGTNYLGLQPGFGGVDATSSLNGAAFYAFLAAHPTESVGPPVGGVNFELSAFLSAIFTPSASLNAVSFPLTLTWTQPNGTMLPLGLYIIPSQGHAFYGLLPGSGVANFETYFGVTTAPVSLAYVLVV